jgi:hypothetical protein
LTPHQLKLFDLRAIVVADAGNATWCAAAIARSAAWPRSSRGADDPEVAGRPLFGERTTASHLTHIYAKPGGARKVQTF